MLVIIAGVLHAAVAVMQQALPWLPAHDRHRQRIAHQVRLMWSAIDQPTIFREHKSITPAR